MRQRAHDRTDPDSLLLRRTAAEERCFAHGKRDRAMSTTIQVFDLWKQYDRNDQPTSAALRGANLAIESGEIIALYGQSGSGKTTLLNLLAGLDRPTSGRIAIDGNDLDAMGEKGKTTLRRRRLGFVFQFFNLLPTLTAFENVFLSLELAGRPDRKSAREALDSVGLKTKGNRYPHELSGGEQQRVAIARAMVKEPAIILADEPTGNLDVKTGEQVLALLTGRCRASGTTLLMATHSPLTCRYSDRILRMSDGIVVEESATPEIPS
jgi:putative ABC transport system ATP-binding protein